MTALRTALAAGARELAAGAPHVRYATRVAIWRGLGEPLPGAGTDGHTRRAELAIASADRVKHLVKEAHWQDDPRGVRRHEAVRDGIDALLEGARAYVEHGRPAREKMADVADRLWEACDAIDCSITECSASAFAAASKAIRVALDDELIVHADDEAAAPDDPYEWDPAFHAALAAAVVPQNHPDHPKRTPAFWRWWLARAGEIGGE